MKKIEFYDNKNIISARLKQARKEKHLSQTQLAAKLQLCNINVDQQIIIKIEKMNARLPTMSLPVYVNALVFLPSGCFRI